MANFSYGVTRWQARPSITLFEAAIRALSHEISSHRETPFLDVDGTAPGISGAAVPLALEVASGWEFL